MRPTLGRSAPCSLSMKREAIRANWRMLCSVASIVAPASRRHAGFPCEVGKSPQRAGRSIPRIRPSTRSAAAIVAPVLPADATASASPCFTISVATPIDVSPRRRRALEGCSSIATTSVAFRMVMPGGTEEAMIRRSSCSRPTRTRSASPPLARYKSAPRTISSGAWSPPMASTAIFMATARLCGRPLGLDRYDLSAAERAAVRTRLVRRLGALALRARHERHGAQRKMTAAFALRRARYTFLGMSCQSDLLDGGWNDSICRRGTS